ncbi:MAG: N-acetyltransferase [bacterium]|nr:N-acetyltransferase [bacterium]
MPNVTIRKVETPADHKAFFEYPWRVYQDDPNWVPPLLSMRKDILNRKKNPSWEYMEGDYYAAWRGDTCVGTIAAFVNNWHNKFHEENVAWFGFFECEDNVETAQVLLQTAVDWARERGYEAVRGPQNFTTHDECGLLVDGFERPIMLMPYNKPYYQRLVEGAGFHKVMDIYSYYYNWALSADARTEERLEKLATRINRTVNVTIRPIDRKNMKADFVKFKEIYNDAWDKNWGFTPMTPKELDNLVTSLGMFFDPTFSCFAEVDGEPVGFMLGVPDFNQVLQPAHARPGEPEPITLVKALWHWKIRSKIDWLRVPLMGVREAYRNRGLDLLMFLYFYKVMRGSRYKHLDCGWILENNHNMLGLLESVGMKIHRTHRFYEKSTSG